MSLTKELFNARNRMLKLLEETNELKQTINNNGKVTYPKIPKFSNILLKCRTHDRVLSSQAALFIRTLPRLNTSVVQLGTAIKKSKINIEPSTLNNLLIFCEDVKAYSAKYREISDRINKLTPITK